MTDDEFNRELERVHTDLALLVRDATDMGDLRVDMLRQARDIIRDVRSGRIPRRKAS